MYYVMTILHYHCLFKGSKVTITMSYFSQSNTLEDFFFQMYTKTGVNFFLVIDGIEVKLECIEC